MESKKWEFLQIHLSACGWTNLHVGNHMGISFDLIGFRRYLGIVKWNILVKDLRLFDALAFEEWRVKFNYLKEESESFLIGRGFFICIIADTVTIPIIDFLSEMQFVYHIRERSMRGGGGHMFLVDMGKKTVYGNKHFFLRDIRIYSRKVFDVLNAFTAIPK